MRPLLFFCIATLAVCQAALAQNPEQRAAFLAPAFDRPFIEGAIRGAASDLEYPEGVTGLIVPHHLVAADLIARGFWVASKGNYDRIILIGPDHFGLLQSGFASTGQGLETVFGPLQIDPKSYETLRAAGISEADVFSDHSLTAIAPFITYFFADVPVVPVLAALNTTPDDWTEMAETLGGLLTEKTLVIQSTDFSHFLSWGEAALRDQATLDVLTSGRVDAVLRLDQPGNLDSRAALAVQMQLQSRIGARPGVFANRNSAEYGGGDAETTSYMLSVYHRDPAALAALSWPDQERVYFGGDIFAGRLMRPFLSDPKSQEVLTDAVANVVGAAPLVANLAGAIWDAHVEYLPSAAHLMERDLVAPILRRLGLAAAGLANNHSYDLGPEGHARTKDILNALGIAPLEHAKRVRVGPVDVIALNFVPSNARGGPVADPRPDLSDICLAPGEAPLVLFLHWGEEFGEQLTERQLAVVRELQECAPAAIFGAHSHRASDQIEILRGQTPIVPSLGNLLFDQPDAMGASAALVEMRVFDQGTYATRIIPLPNAYQRLLDQGVSQ